jgi:predicted nuclease of predicted toxin-antitoxin system
MKFLADMGISPKTVSFLRDLGHKAVHLHQEGLGKLSDSEILENARCDGNIILTRDLDFDDLLAASGAQLPTVIIFRLRDMRPERVHLYLKNVITQHTKALDQGVIATVAEGGVPTRPLPLVPDE